MSSIPFQALLGVAQMDLTEALSSFPLPTLAWCCLLQTTLCSSAERFRFAWGRKKTGRERGNRGEMAKKLSRFHIRFGSAWVLATWERDRRRLGRREVGEGGDLHDFTSKSASSPTRTVLLSWYCSCETCTTEKRSSAHSACFCALMPLMLALRGSPSNGN